MIVVLAGTHDARSVIKALKEAGEEVLASALTPYGAFLAQEAGADQTRYGPLDQKEMESLLCRHQVKAVVDATHPFASEVKAVASRACAAAGVPYLPYARPPWPVPDHPLVETVADWEQAAVAAAKGEVLFLAIGARRLGFFVQHPRLAGKRFIARVLPEEKSLAACRALGLWPRDVVAIQGPVGVDLNRALFRHFQADLLVTKDSGPEGGLPAKIEAAIAEGMRVVLVQRPAAQGLDLAGILAALRGLEKMRRHPSR